MPHPDIAIVLVAPRNPLNIGAVARAMSNFGFDALRIAAAHAPNIEAARSAVDAAPLLARARVFETTADAIADCQHVVGTTTGKARHLQQQMHALPTAAALFARPGRTALLFGSEKHGLSSEDLSFCTELLHIPTRAGHLSMNLGQAAAICLYAIATALPDTVDNQSSERMAYPVTVASSGERELLLQALLDALARTGYGGAEDSAALRQKARRMVGNLGLSGEDARLLLGMVRRLSGSQQ